MGIKGCGLNFSWQRPVFWVYFCSCPASSHWNFTNSVETVLLNIWLCFRSLLNGGWSYFLFSMFLEYLLCARSCSCSQYIVVYKRNKIRILMEFIFQRAVKLQCSLFKRTKVLAVAAVAYWHGVRGETGLQVLVIVLVYYISLSLGFPMCKIGKLNIPYLLSVNFIE